MLLHSAWNTSAGTGHFFGVYLLVMAPMLLAVALVALWQRRRERKAIGRQLAAILPDQVSLLARPRRRRRWIKAAPDDATKQARRAFAEAATALALHRERIARGVLERTPETTRQERALAERALVLRARAA
jgi:protease PrsW